VTHVPFVLDDIYGGLAETRGLISNEGDRLRLQFQTQDSIVGVVKSNLAQIDIPMADVASVRFNSSWFGLSNCLHIQITRLDLLQSLPGSTQGRLHLKVARADRVFAEKFASELSGLGPSGKVLQSAPPCAK
jgi:hypothetical protein